VRLRSGFFTPHYHHYITARCDLDPFSMAFTWRRVGSGKYNDELTECTFARPAVNGIHSTININHIPKIDYFATALMAQAVRSTTPSTVGIIGAGFFSRRGYGRSGTSGHTTEKSGTADAGI